MDVNSTDRQAIRTVIERQLQAFQQNDEQAAFALASPEIQAKFQTPERFLKMVKTEYAAIYQPRSVMFTDLVDVRGIPTQAVILLTQNDHLLKALYLMEQQPDQSWRIGGCFLVTVDGEVQ